MNNDENAQKISVFYKGKKHRSCAFGEYNQLSNELIVKKGSIVSEHIAGSMCTSLIRDRRMKYVNGDGVVMQDVRFKSPSTAANFVTGFNSDGLLLWRVEKNITLRDYINDKKRCD